MADKTTEYYARRGESLDLAHFVTIREKKDGNVHFHNAWGGMGYYAPESEFAAKFEQVDQATITKLFGTYRPIDVNADDGDIHMSGYTNGHLWNGFECPSFTKDEVIRQTAEGGYLAQPGFDDQYRFIWSDKADTFLLIESSNGEPLPEQIDTDFYVDALLEKRTADIDAAEEKHDMYVSLAHKFTVVPVGADAPVTLFVIDSGWTWSEAERYSSEDEAENVQEAAPLRM